MGPPPVKQLLPRSRARRLLPLLGFLALGIVLAHLSWALLPSNMDEFFQYHLLMCKAYPFNALNTFREGCGMHDLNAFNLGWTLFLQSNPYSGSFPSLYYAPLFYLWPSPVSARFLGYLFLLAEAAVLARIFRWKVWQTLLALLLLFPYAVMHITDMGPIAFHCLSIFLLYALVDRWTRTLHWTPAFLAGVTIFLCVWTKLSYLWLLPGIAGMTALLVWEQQQYLFRRRNRINAVLQIVAWTVFTGVLLLLYFRSTQPGNPEVFPLWNELWRRPGYSVGQMLRGEWLGSDVLRAFFSPAVAVMRYQGLPPPGSLSVFYASLFYLFVPLLLCICRWKPQHKKYVWRAVVFYGLFLLTALLIVRTKTAWAMHHAILSYPFLILSIGSLLQTWKKWKPPVVHPNALPIIRIWISMFATLNILLFILAPSWPVRASEDPSRNAIHAILQDAHLAEKYLFVVVDWGMYYPQALYGHSQQAVLYMEPLHAQHITALKNLSKKTGRRLLFVYKQSSAGHPVLARRNFVLVPCSSIPTHHIWQITLEPNGDDENPCLQPTVKTEQ